MGNTAVVMHVASAVIIMLAGAVQLVPQVRNRFPVFHRWNGRIYMLAGFTISIAVVPRASELPGTTGYHRWLFVYLLHRWREWNSRVPRD